MISEKTKQAKYEVHMCNLSLGWLRQEDGEFKANLAAWAI
jgi:hypothetical protein